MLKRLTHLTPLFVLLRHHHLSPTTPLFSLFFSNPPTTFPSLLQTHALLITTGNSTNPFVSAKLISLYASFHHPNLSTHVFHSTPHPRDSFLWNSLVKAHFSNGSFLQSLRLFQQMRASGAMPNHFTVPMVASACAESGEFGFGACFHGGSVKLGFLGGGSASVAAGSSFVYFYSKCGVVDHAIKLFEEMLERDVVSWTALVAGCVSNGECELGLVSFREMIRDGGQRPNYRTVEGGLQACGALEALNECKCLHAFSIKIGTGWSSFVQASLLSVYSKCGSLQEAEIAFHEMNEKDVVSWTVFVWSYARKGLVVECLALSQAMLASGVQPDGPFVSCLLMAFACSGYIRGGKAYHALILRKNFESDPMVMKSLLSMYLKLELLDVVRTIFHMMAEEDVESWNLMIIEYGKLGLRFECLDTFRNMQHLGLYSEANSDTLIVVTSSCSQLGELKLGKSIHCYAIKSKVHTGASTLNSIVSMYGKCGRLDMARRMFIGMDKDTVTWNTLISIYIHLGHHNDALALFDQMLCEIVKPNTTSLKIILSVCSSVTALHRGKWIHKYIKEEGLANDVVLQTSLIDMYSKCGELNIAREIFDSMRHKDVISWNVIISGYGKHGCIREALQVFKQMEEMGVRPNELTFLAVLSACSHAGFVQEGRDIFDKMKNSYSLVPTCKHYACMVDLVGRSGNLNEAESMILKMPISPDGGVWGALLGACKMHNDIEMGERAAKSAFDLDPENDGYYILLANLYGFAGRWNDAEKVREMMRIRRVIKQAGQSAT